MGDRLHKNDQEPAQQITPYAALATTQKREVASTGGCGCVHERYWMKMSGFSRGDNNVFQSLPIVDEISPYEP